MQFVTMGSETGPVIMMMGWPFTTPESLHSVAEKITDMRVILPIWDGQDGSDVFYTTRRDQAVQILSYLKEQGITKVDVLAGVSLGATTALDLADLILQDGTLELGRVLCDSGTYIRSSWLGRFVRNRMVFHVFRKARDGSEDEAMTALLGSRLVSFMTGKDTSLFRPVLADMIHVARHISNKSTRAQQLACCTFDWPVFKPEVTRRFVFIWSANDRTGHAVHQLRAHYPDAVYQQMGSFGHGGLLIHDPANYAAMVRGLVKPAD